MAEGLSPTEVGKELGEHAKHHDEAEHGEDGKHPDRWISIAEALLLSIVTIMAAWSGYSAAKWGTESSLKLAKASATRTKSNREFQGALTSRVGDATTFNAWFTAYIAGDKNGARVAQKRFRPEYDVAFEAWLATHPFTNPHAPPGPQSMPQYKPPGEALSVALDQQADTLYLEGEDAASTGDRYVRSTVILASVLFIVGISSHFPLRGVRFGLIALGACLLLFGAYEVFSLPGPPT
jgi:hypothetical protein